MAPSPPRATVFRLAAPGWLPVGCGGEVPLTVPLPPDRVVGAEVVPAAVVCAEVAIEETAEEAAVVVAAGAEVSGAEVPAALVETTPAGMLKETPAEAQRPVAPSIVNSKSAAEHDFWTQGVRAVMNFSALQMQPKSVVGQPVFPKLLRAQARAHGGILSSWRGKSEALATERMAAIAMKDFILNVIV